MNCSVVFLIIALILIVIAFYPFRTSDEKFLGFFGVVVLLISIVGAWG